MIAAMKKIDSALRFIAAAMSAIAMACMPQSCSEASVETDAPQLREYTFALEPVSGTDTKTSLLTGDVIAWNSTDRIGTYTSGTSNLESSVAPGTPATVTVSLSQPAQTGETLYFYYPYSSSAGSDPAAAVLAIPSEQPGDLGSLPMAALPYTAVQGFSTGEVIPSLRFCPLGSIVELCIYSEVEAYQAEKVQSVTFEAEDGIAGQFTFDLTAVNYSDKSTLGISGISGKKVTVTPTAAAKVGSSRTDVTPLYMVLSPGTHAGTLTVATDKASYVYDLGSREFARNYIKPLAVNLKADVRKAPCYKLVTSVNDITDGRYVIAANCEGTYYAVPGTLPISSYNKVNGSVVTVTNGIVTSEDGAAYAVDIKVNGMQLSISNGSQYLSQTTVDKTDIGKASSEFKWSFTSPSTGKIRLTSSLSNSKSRCLLFRGTDTSSGTVYNCFGSYAVGSLSVGGYYELSFYKYEAEGSSAIPPASQDPVVETGAVSSVTSSSATLSATFRNTTSTPRELRFEYGTSSSSLSQTAHYNDVIPTNGVAFSLSISDLAASTMYYYRAVIQVGDTDIYGDVRSFVTSAAPSGGVPGGLLELPALTGNEDYVGTLYSGSDRNYTMFYSYDKYAAMWVAYPLCKAHTSGSASSSWKYHPNIDQKYQVDIVSKSYGSSYSAGTYARGHQIPNGSRKNNSTMNQQTYYATNQTAQIQNGFNGTIWSAMENAVRGAIPSNDTLYVVTGPVYQTVGGNETINYLTGASGINPNKLPLANYYFKAVLKVKRSGDTITSAIACGFWMEHKAYSNSSYSNYAVSIDYIEEKTGLDLFANLPDDIEATAEKNSSWSSLTSF